MAREASKAVKTTSYECGVLEMETWLAKEVAGVCRDYYTEIWAKVLNQAGVPANSELRRLRMFSSQRTSKKSQQCSLLPLLTLSPLLSSSPPSKPLLLMLKS